MGTEEGQQATLGTNLRPVTSLVQPPDSPSSPSRAPTPALGQGGGGRRSFPPLHHTMNSLLPYRTSCCGAELKSGSLRWLPEVSRGELRLSLSLWRVLPDLCPPSASVSGVPKPQEVSRGPEEEERKR